jgi:CheY-like chemotaxis protein
MAQRIPVPAPTAGCSRGLDLARVLLVHGELAPRLTLQTILQAGGYSVDVAATPAEAIGMLDASRYELVISDSEFGLQSAGRTVLAYARVKYYRPATAILSSYEPTGRKCSARSGPQISIHTENVPNLLSEVAELIGARATRRYRPVRASVAN